MDRKTYLQKLVPFHRAASELAEVIRKWRLVDTGERESRSQAAHRAYRDVQCGLLTLTRFLCLAKGIVGEESQGALPGLWDFGEYYPPTESLQWLRPGELDDIVAGVSCLFQADNSLFEAGFGKGYDGFRAAVPADIGRRVFDKLERGIELLGQFCPQPLQREVEALPDGGKGKKRPRVTVEAKVAALVLKDPSTHPWSSRKFATKLGCSSTAVFNTEVYQRLKTARGLAKLKRAEESQRKGQGRKADRHRKPKHDSSYNKGTRD